MVSREPTPDEQLADALAEFFDDPLGYVMFMFPWDTYEPIQMVELDEKYGNRFPGCKYGPDVWACEFLDNWGDDIRANGFDGRNAVDPLMYATVSGHGIGKSTLTSWIIKFIMDTRPFSKGTVTANTAEQLKTKTWAELGKWHKLSLTEHWFNYNSGRGAMNLTHKKFKEEWRCDGQTCREENSEAFAGQHAASATSFYVFDEASAVPDKIFEVREGGTTDGEPMVFDFGNPTRNSGRFYEECAGKFRHRYKHIIIDSREVLITNKKRIAAWLEDYGEDSDFFKVRVRGLFPSAGSCQFIATELVELAQKRELIVDRMAPLVLGVDVARFGNDESVIYPRIGNDCRSWAPTIGKGRFQGLNTVQLTGKVIETVRSFRALGIEYAALFVDGTGIGGGVVDQLDDLGYKVTEVQFGTNAIDAKTYRYRSDEIWGNLRDKLPRLCLPAMNQPCGNELKDDLTQREYGYTLNGNKIHLEKKADMIARGITSPDIADALALTFASEVAPVAQNDFNAQPKQAIHEYDPLNSNF
ncbi:MAG: hypothetical protein JKY23_06745 [Nitrospinaceae bacterium]|nr:hypothetical protein [Nitrospinaceae bacterium]